MEPETNYYALRSDLARVEVIAFRAEAQAREALRRVEEALAARSSAGQDCDGGTALALGVLDRLTAHVGDLDIDPRAPVLERLAWTRVRGQVLELLGSEREVLLAKKPAYGP